MPCLERWPAVAGATLLAGGCAHAPGGSGEVFRADPVPQAVVRQMVGSSWREGCPVTIAQLAYLTVAHRGFDGAAHVGHLVVHAALAAEVLDIFRELFAADFPIERIELVDAFGGSDDRSMEANNSSAFNCRMNTTTPGVFSKHAYGYAIDVNPKVNPYAKPQVDWSGRLLTPLSDGSTVPPLVEPASGAAYLDRSRRVPGMVMAGDACHAAFAKRGWTWGGDFVGRTDYQHFEKVPPMVSELVESPR